MSSFINIIGWPDSYFIYFNFYCKNLLYLMIVKVEVIESKNEWILQNLAGLVVLYLASLVGFECFNEELLYYAASRITPKSPVSSEEAN